MNPYATHALVAVAASAAMVCAYDRLFARPAFTLRVVDTLAVFRLEEERLAGLMGKDMSPEQRERLAAQARAFAVEFPRALEQLAEECACVVVERSAVVGTPPRMIDLTPELIRRMQL